MTEKYLPIGTVVMLKGGKKRIMITGFACKTANSDKIYDYCGCLYPEGFIASNQNLLFNHDQIESISFIGLIDEEEKKFKQKLNRIILNNKNIPNTQTIKSVKDSQNTGA